MNTVKAFHSAWNSVTTTMTSVAICLALSFLFYSGCAHSTSSFQQQVVNVKHEELMRTTTKELLSTVEPTLLKLQVGTLMQSSGLTWNVREINNGRGKVYGLSASSYGWLGPLSGGVLGAGFQFGNFYGRSGSMVYGMHVYGYTWMGRNLIPRYIVSTEADVISEKEFEALKQSEPSPAGWFMMPGDKETKVFFKNVRISKVQKMDIKEPSAEGAKLGDPVTSQSYVTSYLTTSAFSAAEKKITQLRPGTSAMEVIQFLEGKLVLFPPNDTLVVYGINGLLNYKGQYRFEKVTADGYFSVWPFGFVEGDVEKPKVALIFKNGEVLKVVPYTSQEELKSLFH